jgi:hypothetical protein
LGVILQLNKNVYIESILRGNEWDIEKFKLTTDKRKAGDFSESVLSEVRRALLRVVKK